MDCCGFCENSLSDLLDNKHHFNRRNHPQKLVMVLVQCKMPIAPLPPPVYISPLTLYGHVMGFFLKIYGIVEKSHKLSIKNPITSSYKVRGLMNERGFST